LATWIPAWSRPTALTFVIDSGKAAELREVGFPALQVGVSPLLGFFGHVVEKRGVSRQLLDPGFAVELRVEGGLEAAQGERAHGQDFAAPAHGLLFEPLHRHHRVHEPHLERLLGIVLAAEKPDLARLLLADDPGQVRGAEATGQAAQPWARQAEA